MADMEDDKDVSRRYRELGREEPPPALDARLRAEARSALETRAAPLVAPTGRRRWYFPVAAAAVIMLAVAVTTQVEREQPSEPAATASEGKKEAAPTEQGPKVEEAKPQKQAEVESLAKRRIETAPAAPAKPAPAQPRAFSEQPRDQVAPQASSGERSRDQFSRDNRERQERPSAAPPAASASASPPVSEPVAPAPARGDEARKKEDGVQPQQKPAPPQAAGAASNLDAASAAAMGYVVQTPEKWLETIAELRRQGKHDEADKQLEAFRKQYPDYKISPEMLKKVERK